MPDNKIDLLLSVVIVPRVVGQIHQKMRCEKSFAEVLNNFYNSRTFSIIVDYKTGAWHLSADTLADIYISELANDISIPQEQS